jgi:DNA-binding IclR family transcriptional regulator
LGETLSLVALRNGFEMEILIREVCEQEIMLSPNRNKPLYSTASGRCLLAQMHSDILDEVIRRDGLPDSWMWEGVGSRADLEKELEKIRTSRRCEIISRERHVAAFGYIPEFSGRFSPLAVGSSLPLFRYEKMEQGAYKKMFDGCCARIDAVLKSEI